MILIVGATGHLGREVSGRLQARGQPLRLMTRSPARLRAMAGLGVDVVAGDLTDPASLAGACAGVSAVLAAAHGILGRGRYRSEAVDDQGHRDLIAAARGAGVQRFVYVSALGAAPDHPVDFFRTKHRIERELVASGLPHVILRPAAFMEQHVHDFNGKGVLETGKARLIGPATKPRNFVAVRDVAHFAELALTDPALLGRSLDIGGPDNLSNGEVAALYARALGVAPRAAHLPAGVARAIGVLLRPLHPGVARILSMSSLPDDAFDERFDPARLPQGYPHRFTTVEAFVRERVAQARA